jgi:hypothetical protein
MQLRSFEIQYFGFKDKIIRTFNIFAETNNQDFKSTAVK